MSMSPTLSNADSLVETVKARRTTFVRLLWANPRARAGLIILMAMIVVAILAPVLAPYNPTSTNFIPSQAPSPRHLLGTTLQGQDILSQLIWGSRHSLGVGLAVGVIATVLSLLIGVLPSIGSRQVNTVFATVTNIVLILPGLPLLIVLSAYLHSSGAFTIAAVIGFTGWAFGARTLRSQVMTLRQRDFVIAARLAGSSQLRLLVREILPNMLSLVMANFMFSILFGILSEAGLQFLGLGNVNAVSWGSIIYWSENGSALLLGMWWWFIPPGAAIALVGIALALVNSGIDQVSNPRLRTVAKTKKGGILR